MNKFLWQLFAKGLDLLLLVLSVRAAKTPTFVDDAIINIFEKVGDIFIPGQVSEDGKAWLEAPLTDPISKGEVARNITAVGIKELLLMPEFRKAAKMDDIQADRTLIAALSFLKPEAVDTQEEIDELVKRGDIL